VVILKGRDHLRGLNMDGIIILNWSSVNRKWWLRMGSKWPVFLDAVLNALIL
jgi:hypothetical protein